MENKKVILYGLQMWNNHLSYYVMSYYNKAFTT